ncbi:Uncharacterised protein [Mycoplasma putrefaciens]|nr:Uncharacterised protein [Mycoplasma putrefaciens]
MKNPLKLTFCISCKPKGIITPQFKALFKNTDLKGSVNINIKRK